MHDNTTTTADGVEIYTNRIYELADEYINRLPDASAVSTPNSNCFTGMIKYINRNMGFTKDIYADLNLLNDIWDIYTDLVYKYMQKPTIEEYALLIGISRETLYSWMNGITRVNDNEVCYKLGSSRSDTVKKWQEECKLGRYKGAASGNVGMIFLCKAVDGMAETAPVQTQAQISQIRSSTELLEDMRKLNGNGTQLAIDGE